MHQQRWTSKNVYDDWYEERQQRTAHGVGPAKESSGWFQPLVIALMCLMLLAIAGTFAYIYLSNTQATNEAQAPIPTPVPTPVPEPVPATCEGLTGFWPCGTPAGDTDTVTSSTVRVDYTATDGITYNMFGGTTGNKVVISFLCQRGLVFLDGTVFSGGQDTVEVPGSRLPAEIDRYDVPVAANGQYCLHRKATPTDLAAIDCLISGFVPTEAYVFTWLKSSFNGNNVGSFQVLVAFAGDVTHVISNYHSDLESSGTVPNGQFHTYADTFYNTYETTTTVDDVKGKRTVFALTNSIPESVTDLVPSTLSSADCPY